MTTRGIEDVYLLEGNVNGELFLQFVQRCLLNVIKPLDGNNAWSVVMLDNASIHHLDAFVNLITAAGGFLSQYSPDLNPIEEVFSKIKTLIEVASFPGPTHPRKRAWYPLFAHARNYLSQNRGGGAYDVLNPRARLCDVLY